MSIKIDMKVGITEQSTKYYLFVAKLFLWYIMFVLLFIILLYMRILYLNTLFKHKYFGSGALLGKMLNLGLLRIS